MHSFVVRYSCNLSDFKLTELVSYFIITRDVVLAGIEYSDGTGVIRLTFFEYPCPIFGNKPMPVCQLAHAYPGDLRFKNFLAVFLFGGIEAGVVCYFCLPCGERGAQLFGIGGQGTRHGGKSRIVIRAHFGYHSSVVNADVKFILTVRFFDCFCTKSIVRQAGRQ